MKISSFLILLTTILSLNLLHGAQGTVFNDKNQNGKKDKGEPGLPNIAVSNGKEITKTDAQGKWELPHDDDTIFFVIKPRKWRTPLYTVNLPQFYYIDQPKGSPPILKY